MTSQPKRIQRRRTKGWRMPAGAVYVGRPTRWGNPFLLSDVARRFPSLTAEQCAGFVVNEYRDRLQRDLGLVPAYLDELRAELAGRDLVCWCPLDQPCHAVVLLELVNGPGS